MLLHWSTLEPADSSELAAIRFSTPVRVQSIRVFPTGAQPFSQSPEIVARTEPKAFFLDVFFNAQPIHTTPSGDAKQKLRAANALVPTAIAYAGGPAEFLVDMGAEHATRLMIVKGIFESISMAIYGDVVSDNPSPKYETKPLPTVEPVPLSRPLDPSNSSDPTILARQLLSLIPDAPSLPLVVRLMLCLKPSNDDWELPEFPHLYVNLDEDIFDLTLENVFQCTTRPVSDETPIHAFDMFARKVSDIIGPKNSNQSYLIAGILYHASSQHPDLARSLLRILDFEQIFDSSSMDEMTVLRLLDAVTNADIARHFNNNWFMHMLNDMQMAPDLDDETKLAIRRLSNRIRGWQVFEDALSDTQADFHSSVNMLKDIGTEERSFGIWLESMITHEDLLSKLAENPVLPLSQSHPPPLVSSMSLPSISHNEFVAFVRAFIGVSSVMAVYAWADSLPNDRCRERTLGVLRLWQDVDGYREIVNHLLLLRQMTFRLECMTTDNDPPTKSGIHAEHILVNLSREPQAMLTENLVKCILSLRPPLSSIDEDERKIMRKVAIVAEDGLPAAVEELIVSNKQPMDIGRIRTLRVALAIIERELTGDPSGEWRVLQELWDERSHGLVPHLVDVFLVVASDLRRHFALQPPPQVDRELVNQLFRTANDILKIIGRMISAFPLAGREMRGLVKAVADIFVCTDAADMLYSQGTAACIAAQTTRQTCIDLVRNLCDPPLEVGSNQSSSELVLRTLLEHGACCGNSDPAYHLLQVFCLIDHLLPFTIDEKQSHWVLSDIPNVLFELQAFFRILDVENKVHFIKRLVNLDNGAVGIGEWLLLEELEALSHMLRSYDLQSDQHGVGRHHIYLCLRFIRDLISGQSNASAWCFDYMRSAPDCAQTLGTCFMSLLRNNISSSILMQICAAIVVNPSFSEFDHSLRCAIMLMILRSIQEEHRNHNTPHPTIDDAPFDTVLRILQGLSAAVIDAENLTRELGMSLSAILVRGTTDDVTANGILSIMEWLARQHQTSLTMLHGITDDALGEIFHRIRETISPNRLDALEFVQSAFRVSSDSSVPFHEPLNLPESIELPMHIVEDMLQPPISAPSTPRSNPAATQDVLGLVTISPPTAILRSPAVTGLTKTYLNNDFRQLRQVPSARQNTSRLPSMHVDEFEVGDSSPVPISPTDGFFGQALQPPFNT